MDAGVGILKASQPKTTEPEAAQSEPAWPVSEKVAMLAKPSFTASRRSQTDQRTFAVELKSFAVEP